MTASTMTVKGVMRSLRGNHKDDERSWIKDVRVVLLSEPIRQSNTLRFSSAALLCSSPPQCT